MSIPQACEYTGLNLSLNPVKTNQTFILSVELHDFSHDYWGGFKHVELIELTHDDMCSYHYIDHEYWEDYTHDQLSQMRHEEITK